MWIGWFTEVYKSLKVNANNSKVLMLGREKGLVYEVVQMEGTFSAFHSLNTWEWNAACIHSWKWWLWMLRIYNFNVKCVAWRPICTQFNVCEWEGKT